MKRQQGPIRRIQFTGKRTLYGDQWQVRYVWPDQIQKERAKKPRRKGRVVR